MKFLTTYILWVFELLKAFVSDDCFIWFILPLFFVFLIHFPLSMLHLRSGL